MSAHVIGNPVPTPEEMGEILGLSSDRVAAVRRIMSAPRKKTPVRSGFGVRIQGRKKSVRTGTSSRSSAR